MNDTPEHHAAIQPALSQIQFYPLSQFDGKTKTKDCQQLVGESSYTVTFPKGQLPPVKGPSGH